MNTKSHFISHLFVITISVLLSLIAVMAYMTFSRNNQTSPTSSLAINGQETSPQGIAPVTPEMIDQVQTREQVLVDIVQKVNPAVVSVVVTKDIPNITRFRAGTGNPFFDQFFGDSFGQPDQSTPDGGSTKQEVGGGSGFFVSADGFVVTNRHVVNDRDADYTILTNDGQSYEAEILAVDPSIDIAVLKVSDQQEFTFLSFANSDQLKLGQTAIAIGNALAEFRNSVSVGVVSGLSRSITAGSSFGQAETLDNVIQTDTAINPGNSGGPLMNIRGEVIGVNVAVARGSENIGFALPSNIVERIVTSVKENGEIIRPFLGVRYIPVSESVAQNNNLSVDYGSLIQRGQFIEDLAVMPGSPADKAGLRENDIILEVDGEQITTQRPLATILREKDVDQTITLKVLRLKEELTLQATLEKAPSQK